MLPLITLCQTKLIQIPMIVSVIDSFPEEFIASLQALPIELRYHPKISREEALEWLADTEVLILNSKIHVDREAIDAAPHLRKVIRAGVGMDHIDEAYLAERGVAVHNTAGANADAVGEQTVGMLLALRHNILRADRQVRGFQWLREANRGIELGGKAIGLIGYGNTGRAVARRLSGFRPRVLAYDKYQTGYGEIYAAQASMEQIFEQAEVLSLHIPLTDETRELVDLDFLRKFRQPIFLLNLARGPIVHLPSLIQGLDEGLVLGAALDVLPNEKLDRLSDEEKKVYRQLFDRENVILTPHIGGWTWESRQNINQRILELVKEEIVL